MKDFTLHSVLVTDLELEGERKEKTKSEFLERKERKNVGETLFFES
jgi:hypothetical protein